MTTSYGEDLEELTVAVILMARLQPVDDNADNVPSYDAKAISLNSPLQMIIFAAITAMEIMFKAISLFVKYNKLEGLGHNFVFGWTMSG
ncbi:hypothetical protein Tco_1429531 [Tanacetum coccineum]